MSFQIECPQCGESDRARLSARREPRGIFITCGSCETTWERHPDSCPACRERTVVPQRMPLLQKARGTQQSIIGYYMAKRCTACGWTSEGPPETSAV